MFISTVPGVAPRGDDAAVMAELMRCAGQATGEPRVIGLMNEAREVYRLVVFGTANQDGCLLEALKGMGFHQLEDAPPAYREVVHAVFWKP